MTTLTRILLIEDDSVDRAAVRRALSKSTLIHSIVEAEDGARSLAAVAAEPFDCVLLDYRLPDIDTFDLLRILVSPEGGNQAVIVLTGQGDQEIALKLMRAGALDFLTKAEATPSILARAIRYAKARKGFVGELQAARAAAEAQSVALDSLNRQKTLLLSIIAHDLRNPFQSLIGLADSLSRAVEKRDPAAIEVRAQGIAASARQAHALLESLVAWAKVQMDTAEVDIKEVDLSGVIEDVLESYRERAADKAVGLHASAEGLSARGHRDMIATVLRNLVGNAIKFTQPGGLVNVTGHQSGSAIEINVADSGVGIPHDRLGGLFRLDRRDTTLGTAGERGSGLGLLLCRDLVQLQGGELRVASEVGSGTIFSFTLPAAGAEMAAVL